MTLNGVMAVVILRYFTELVYDVVVKQLPRFQNLLFSVRYMLSPVRLSVVCNVRAPYSGGSNFRQYFYGIMYLAIR